MLMLPQHAPPVEGIEYASILSRICAQVIDAIIFVIASQVLGFIFGIIVGLFLLPNPYRVVTVEEYEAAVVIWTNRYVVGYVLLATLYYFYYLVRYDGQTPGKSLMKIRIVRQDGEHFTLPDAVIRNLIGYPVSTLLLFSGHLWAIADPKRQTLHDKMTQTVVLKDRFVYNNIRAEQNS